MTDYQFFFRAERAITVSADSLEEAKEKAWDELRQELNDINPLSMFGIDSIDEVKEL